MKKNPVFFKGPVAFPTIVVLGQKVRSNVVSIVQFFVLIPNLASDLPYVAYFGGKATYKCNYIFVIRGFWGKLK